MPSKSADALLQSSFPSYLSEVPSRGAVLDLEVDIDAGKTGCGGGCGGASNAWPEPKTLGEWDWNEFGIPEEEAPDISLL